MEQKSTRLRLKKKSSHVKGAFKFKADSLVTWGQTLMEAWGKKHFNIHKTTMSLKINGQKCPESLKKLFCFSPCSFFISPVDTLQCNRCPSWATAGDSLQPMSSHFILV